MARFVSVLGFLDGKLQNTVTATVKGQSTIRAYQPNVSNPNTEKQASNREVMAYITVLANFLNFAVLVPYLRPKSRVQSPINSFNSQLGRLVTLIANATSVIRSQVVTSGLANLRSSNLMVANGPLSITINSISGSASSSTSSSMTLSLATATANLSRADASTDTLTIVTVNLSTPNTPVVTTTPIPRSSGSVSNASINVPSRTATDVIGVFVFYKNNNNQASKGMIVGTLLDTTFTATTTRTYVA